MAQLAAEAARAIDGPAGPAPRTSARRAEVVRAAARLFSERGYHGTSMQHLADALGVLRGSLYAHIGSKEELLFEVVDDGADRFLERGAAAADGGSPAADRLRALLVSHIEIAFEHIDAATVFLNEWRYLSEPLRDVIQDKRDRYEAMVRGVINDGVEAGEFRGDLDVTLAARLVLSAANWTYTWLRPQGDLAPVDVANQYADLLVQGLKNERKSTVEN